MRNPTSLLKKSLLLALCAGAPGCPGGEDGAEVALRFSALPQGLGTPCSAAPSAAEFQADVQALRMRVSGPGMKTMEKTFSVTGEIQMEKVPVGENRNVLVSGLKETLTVWRGQARHVKVEPNTASSVDVLLTKVADLTCARNGMAEPRSFHTATSLLDGRVLIVGGVTQETAATTCVPTGGICRSMVATNTADLFDPGTGQFTAVPGLMGKARAFHTAALLPDGRVLIAGGASAAQLNSLAPFPIIPAQPVTEVEVFDPATGMFTVVWQDTEGGGRTFPASLTLTTGPHAGAVLITGGGNPTLWDMPLPTDVNSNVARALRSTLLCAETCQEGPPMRMRRVGHVMAQLTDGKVLVYGGSIETGTELVGSSSAPRQGPEFFNGSEFAFEAVDGALDVNNMFFGAAMVVPGMGGVFIVGGVARATDTTALRFNAPQPQVWFYSEDMFMSPGTDTQTWTLNVPRLLPAVAPLGADAQNWVVAGGFRDALSQWRPADTLEVFDGGRLLFKTIRVAQQDRTLRQPRGGVVAAGLVSGPALLTGGTTLDGSNVPSVLQTAEIYTDTQEPPP